MSNKKKIDLGGQLRDAVEVHVNQSTELWNTYLLDDGTTLKFKSIMVEVLRIEGMYDPDGNPLYATKTQTLAVADAPPHLKKKS